MTATVLAPAVDPSGTASADPTARIAAVFERIAATRMRDFPLSNAALRVEAVGFRHWNGVWVGVLVTPWAMNLLLLDGGNPSLRALATGQAQAWQFPSGEYTFYGLDEAGLGVCQMCSLFSPMADFPAQAGALATAGEIMNALFVDPDAVPPSAQPYSRRAFMFGRGAGQA